MRTSEKCGAIVEAFAKAQRQFKNPHKNQQVKYGNTNFKYADLTACLDAVLPALNAEGIALMQGVRINGEAQIMVTRLSLGEEWLACEYPVGPANAEHKDVGAAYTYGKRYSLASLCGISADDDTDASEVKTRAAAPKADNTAKVWKDDQVRSLNHMEEVRELDNWEITNADALKKLSNNHAKMSEDLEAVVENTRKRVTKNAETLGD